MIRGEFIRKHARAISFALALSLVLIAMAFFASSAAWKSQAAPAVRRPINAETPDTGFGVSKPPRASERSDLSERLEAGDRLYTHVVGRLKSKFSARSSAAAKKVSAASVASHDISVDISASVATAAPGTAITYDLSATNNGPDEGPSVIVSSTLDPRVLLTDSDKAGIIAAGGEITGSSISWNMHSALWYRLGLGSSDSEGNGAVVNMDRPSLSEDGRYLLFVSYSPLVGADNNGAADVYRKDNVTGQVVLVSKTQEGVVGSAESSLAAMSRDGRFVAFATNAANLAPGLPTTQIVLKDLTTGAVTPVSANASGIWADLGVYQHVPTLSDDGRYVGFTTKATNLSASDTNGSYDGYVKDTRSGNITRVTVADDGSQGDKNSGLLSLSADGLHVAFESNSSNFSSGSAVGFNVFVRDLDTGDTTLITRGTDGLPSPIIMAYPVYLSADGERVAFTSSAANLVPGDSGYGLPQAFVASTHGSLISLVSRYYENSQIYGNSYATGISDNGTKVSFWSDSPYVADSWGGGQWWAISRNPGLFVRDLNASTTKLVSANESGLEINSEVTRYLGAMSSNGNAFAFVTEATGIDSKARAGKNIYVRRGIPTRNWSFAAHVAPDSSFPGGTTTVTTTISAFCSTDPIVENNSASAAIGVNAPELGTDLSVYKKASVSSAKPGDPVDYTITLTNSGPGMRPIVAMRDTFDVEHTALTADDIAKINATGGTVSGDHIDWNLTPDSWYKTTPISQDAPNGMAFASNSFNKSQISENGRYVSLITTAALVANDTNGVADIYRKDNDTGQIELVSKTAAGVVASAESSAAAMSRDGRYFSFNTVARNLASGTTKKQTVLKDMQTGEVRPVSTASDGTWGDGDVRGIGSVSDDGRYVGFTSGSANLVLGDTNGQYDSFVKDVQTGSVTRVSVSNDGTQSDKVSGGAVLSADGKHVAFLTEATNFGYPAPDIGYMYVFVRHLDTNTTTLVSKDAAGNPMGAAAYAPAMSADGQWVAFHSTEAFDSADAYVSTDVFYANTHGNVVVKLASATADGTRANWDSYYPSISGDGRYICFWTSDSTLAGTDGRGSVIVKDTLTGEIKPAASGYAGSIEWTSNQAMSSDGSSFALCTNTGYYLDTRVALGKDHLFVRRPQRTRTFTYTIHMAGRSSFESGTSSVKNMVTASTANDGDLSNNTASASVAVENLGADIAVTKTSSVNTATPGDPVDYTVTLANNGPAYAPATRLDDVFDAEHTALTADDIAKIKASGGTVSGSHINWNLTSESWYKTKLVTGGASGGVYTGGMHKPQLSEDGRYVAFVTTAALDAADTNGVADVYRKDNDTGSVELVSKTQGGVAGSADSSSAAMSLTGRFISFNTVARNLVSGTTKNQTVLKDMDTGEVKKVSAASDGTWGDADAFGIGSVSEDGTVIGFTSGASNLVSGDTNGVRDSFVKNLTTGEVTRVSVGASGQQGDKIAGAAALSADGRHVAFISLATNFGYGAPSSGYSFIYVRHLDTNTTVLVSRNAAGDPFDSASYAPAISADGEWVAFQSSAQFDSADTNYSHDVFYTNTYGTTVTRLASVKADGTRGDEMSSFPSVSEDGRYICFSTYATNLTDPASTNSSVLVKDTLTGQIKIVALGYSGSIYWDTSQAMSPDGSAFALGTNVGYYLDTNASWLKPHLFMKRAAKTLAFTYTTHMAGEPAFVGNTNVVNTVTSVCGADGNPSNDSATASVFVKFIDVPSGLAASNVTSSGATLTWSPVAGAAEYQLFRNTTDTPVALPGRSSYTVHGLEASKNYTFWVKAVGSSGKTSALSVPAVVRTSGAPVVSLKSSAGAGASGWYTGKPVGVVISADDPSGIARIDATVTAGATRTQYGSNTSPLAFQISADGIHTVEYRALDSDAEVTTGTGQIKIDTGVASPDTPALSGVTGNSATVTWTSVNDSLSGMASYLVTLSDEGGVVATASVSAGTTTRDFTRLSAATNYSVTVSAVDNAGNTSTSRAAEFRTRPATPTDLSADVTSSTALLSWSPVSGAVGYQVFVTTTGTPVATVTSTSYTATSLAAGSNYTFYVRAIDSLGVGSNLSIGFGFRTSSATAPVSTLTYAPAASESGWHKSRPTSVTITGSDPLGIKRIDATVTAGGVSTHYSSVSVTTLTFAVNTEGTSTIAYRVEDNGTPVEATSRSAYIKIDTGVNTPPSGLSVSGVAANSASLSWVAGADAISGISHYKITANPVSGGTAILSADIPRTSGTISGLSAATTYTVTVTAYDVAGNASSATPGILLRTTAAGSSGGGGTGGGGGSGGGSSAPVLMPPVLPSGWANDDVVVVLATTPESGKTTITYSINGEASRAYSAPVVVAAEGTTTIAYSATSEDGGQQTEAMTAVVRIDKTRPTAVARPAVSRATTTSILVRWSSSTDALSGVHHYNVYDGDVLIASPTTTTLRVLDLKPGIHSYRVRAVDAAGNLSATATDGSDEVAVESDFAPTPWQDFFTSTSTSPSLPSTLPSGMRLIFSMTPSTTSTAAYPLNLALPYSTGLSDARAEKLTVIALLDGTWRRIPVVVDTDRHELRLTLSEPALIAVVESALVDNSSVLLAPAGIVQKAYGQGSQVSVRCTDASGTPLPHQLVLLHMSVSNPAGGVGAAALSTTVTMTPDTALPGTYKATVRPLRTSGPTYLRFVLPGDSVIASSTASSVLMPKAKVTLYRTASSINAGRKVALVGRLLPRHSSKSKLTVIAERVVRGRVVGQVKKNVSIAANKSAFSATLVLRSKGDWRIRVLHSDSTHAASYSSYRYLKVK